MAYRPQHDPNPGFGRVPLLDVVKAVVGVGAVSVQSLVFALARLVPGRGKPAPSFKLFLIRALFDWLPDSVLRRPAGLEPLFASKRYGARAAAFVERVDRPGLSGIWLKPELAQLAQAADGATDVPETAAPVAEADVVVLFAHGGGYVVGHPAMFVTLWLRVVEAAAAQGQRVAVFLVDYGLAPEHAFPHQLRDMTAAWDYAVGELGVAPARLALAGDSAGGSLCLSFLAHRAAPLAGVPAVAHGADARPGRGLFLLSPWVSLTSERGYAARAETDLLPRARLRAWAAATLQGADAANAAMVQQYLEFSGTPPRSDWAALLPAYTYVTAGGGELFLDNIKAFAAAAQAAGCRVDLAVEPGQPHDWQMAEAGAGQKALYAQAQGVPEVAMPGVEALAKAIVSTAEERA